MVDSADVYSNEGLRNLTKEEMEQRNIEMGPLMKNCNIYSRAEMMNANRPNIMDRIIMAAADIKRFGREPSTVYLGEKEVAELLAYTKKIRASMGNPVKEIEERVCGYDLVRVEKESYFAVH
jgi:hypothetical protein